MEHRPKIKLDHRTLSGRVRVSSRDPRSRRRDAVSGWRVASHSRPTQVGTLAQEKTTPSSSTHSTLAHVAASNNLQTVKNINSRPDLPRQTRSQVLKREIVQVSAKRYHHKHRRPLRALFLPATTTLFVASSGILLVAFLIVHKSNMTQKTAVKAATTEAATATQGLSEDNPPADLSAYKVAPEAWRLLTVDKLSIKARIFSTGLGADQVPAAPNNIFDIGWYDGSAKPGTNNTVILTGHVTGPTKHGVFYSLSSLTAGDKIKLEQGNGKILSYTVVRTKTFDSDKISTSDLTTSAVSGKAGLTLLTSNDRFDIIANRYEPRFAIFAVRDS